MLVHSSSERYYFPAASLCYSDCQQWAGGASARQADAEAHPTEELHWSTSGPATSNDGLYTYELETLTQVPGVYVDLKLKTVNS